jgi:hypothetical protein
MDVDEVLRRLNAALAQQRRSVMQFTTASGSMFGLEVQGIPPSGQEPRSEALEHLIEHMIMRKQNQVDWLRRAIRRP